MAIVVVGGGAIGLLMAGRLTQQQQPVALIARPTTVATLHNQPLEMTYRGHCDVVTHLVAVADPANVPPPYQRPALMMICVKGYDMPSTFGILNRLQPAYVLSLQNGFGHEEALAQQIGRERVIAGSITTSVQSERPAAITITRMGGIGLAPLVHNATTTRELAHWQSVLRQAGFRVTQYRQYHSLKWSKVLLNMLGNATVALLDLPVDAVYANHRLIEIEQALFLEALHVMRYQGIQPINVPRYPAAWLSLMMQLLPRPVLFPLLQRLVGGGRGGKLPSLLLDLRQGRGRTEGAYLYGAVVAAAERHGLSVPVNTVIWQLLHDIVSGALPWETFRHQPQRLIEVVAQARTQTPIALSDKE
ncbi:MAG: ketopantoate reductase family protein [Chloroflexaceae bacterium]|nr:ketopantoate reductase family protein [Chloroflexaceae bacterium]